MSFKQIFLGALEFFFPRACALCGGSLIGAAETRYGLCEDCSAEVAPVAGERCNLCGKPLISEKGTCISCRNGTEKSYDRLWVLFPYTGKYRKLLTAYKFKKNLALAEFFREKIWEIIADNPVLSEAVVVPVPPRPGKIKETGWDQVDYLVKRVEKNGDEQIPVRRCLRRRKSKVQKRLTRAERMENLKGRIYVHGTVSGTVLIIDDVITTGSTLEVCASALKAGGAEKVYGLCLFYD